MKIMRLTQEALAERLGVTQGAVAHWLSGRREPDLETLEKILEITGFKSILITDEPDGHGAAKSNVAPMLQPRREAREYPVISWVSAGERAESPDNYAPGVAEEWLPSTENAGPNGYWLRVKGKSMTSDTPPSFPEGTPILVQPEGFDVLYGKFYVAKHKDGETTFKQYVYDGGTEYLTPLNPAFKIIEMDGDWTIIGRVIDMKAPSGVL